MRKGEKHYKARVLWCTKCDEGFGAGIFLAKGSDGHTCPKCGEALWEAGHDIDDGRLAVVDEVAI